MRAAVLASVLAFAPHSIPQVISPQVRLEHLAVTDAGMEYHARRMLLTNVQRVLHCYETGLAIAPDLAGHVRMQVDIATDGTVPSATVLNAPRPLATVATCIGRAARSMQFPSSAAPWQIDFELALSVPHGPRSREAIRGR